MQLDNADCKKKIQLSYSKIVANRGRYNRKFLAKLYSVFTDHSVLFLSGIYPIFHKKRYRFNSFLLFPVFPFSIVSASMVQK